MTLSSVLSSQHQQQLGNIYASNYIAPAQSIQTNVFVNVSNVNLVNNVSNEMMEQRYANDNNQNDARENSVSEIEQSKFFKNSSALDLSFSFRSSKSSNSSLVSSRLHKHLFTKKLKKFERNFYGKIAMHKKSKHLVDVCFNWR